VSYTSTSARNPTQILTPEPTPPINEENFAVSRTDHSEMEVSGSDRDEQRSHRGRPYLG
jgi:hypothetical protein